MAGYWVLSVVTGYRPLLTAKYDFTLTVKSTGANTVEPMFNFSEEALNDALRQQLGLQLLSQQAEVDVMTIEHAEKPKVD